MPKPDSLQGSLDLLVLKILSRRPRLHGYGIMQETLERTNGAVRIWPATLYGVLQRMIAGGLIEESEERPAPELDDARRRYYKLTQLGRTVLDLECERLRDMLRMAQRKRRQEAY